MNKAFVIYAKNKLVLMTKKYYEVRDHCHTLEDIETLLIMFAI